MRLLLDTHFLIWLTDEPGRVTANVRNLLADDAHDIAVSAVSCWEIRLKWQSRNASGRRKLQTSPKSALAAVAFFGFHWLDLTAAIAAVTLDEPISHTDPFDELLLLVAQVDDRRLLTHDNLLKDHPLALFA